MTEKQNDQRTDLEGNRHRLQADCETCFGLCCVALPFATSVDFALDKAAGQACRNLREDFRCGIHDSLRSRGFRGCTVYDCFGAGQQVSQVTFNGQDWQQNPVSAVQMFEVFPIMWQLHELLWYLSEALTLQAARPIHSRLSEAFDETESLTLLEPSSLLELNMSAHRAKINELLLQTSELVRADAMSSWKIDSRRRKTYSRGADLVGAKLKGADLRGANLRGAYLIAADLRGADLRAADLIGADLRDTDLRGTNLSSSLFLTQAQINAAKGDVGTELPQALAKPAHWL